MSDVVVEQLDHIVHRPALKYFGIVGGGAEECQIEQEKSTYPNKAEGCQIAQSMMSLSYNGVREILAQSGTEVAKVHQHQRKSRCISEYHECRIWSLVFREVTRSVVNPPIGVVEVPGERWSDPDVVVQSEFGR